MPTPPPARHALAWTCLLLGTGPLAALPTTPAPSPTPVTPAADPAPAEEYPGAPVPAKPPARLTEKEMAELRSQAQASSARLAEALGKLALLDTTPAAKPGPDLLKLRKETDDLSRQTLLLLRRIGDQESLPPPLPKGETKEPSPLPLPIPSERTEDQVAARILFTRGSLALVEVPPETSLRNGAEAILSRDLVQLTRGTVLHSGASRAVILTTGFPASVKQTAGEILLVVKN